MAVGVGGFKDYVVFGFTEKDKYVLESPSLGNATYVLDGNWQEVSVLTKKEIIEEGLHEERVIHNRSWPRRVRQIVS
jgi:hypothetical protein